MNLAHLKCLGNTPCEQFRYSVRDFKKWEKEHLFRFNSHLFGASAFIFKSTSKVCMPQKIFSCFICFELNEGKFTIETLFQNKNI